MVKTTEPIADATGPSEETTSHVPVVPVAYSAFLRRQRDAVQSERTIEIEDVAAMARDAWKADVPASIVVFLVALPLCLGIALASGAPLFAGIIAGIVGGIVVGAVSQSQLMVSGPAAGLTAIVVSAIASLGSFRAFLVAVVLAGAVQIALGLVGAGVVGYVFPMAVIKGMLAAIGIILILKQLPHAVGYDADYAGDEAFRQANAETTFSSLGSALEKMHPGAVTLAIVSLLLLVVWERTSLRQIKLLPAPLAVVVAATALNAAFAALQPAFTLSGDHLVSLPIPESLASFGALFVTPDWSAIANAETWRIAVTIGIVASLESLLSLSATNRIDPYRREPSTNRELVAQGVGNMASGLIGGLPVTGVIVRSSANVDAGARTKRSTIIHGVLLLCAVAAIPAILNRIPIAPLAVILIYTGFKLAHPKLMKHAWLQGWQQFIPFAVTIAAILMTDLLVGIGVGLAVGLFFVLLEHQRSPAFTEVSAHGSVLLRLRLNETVSFLNKASLATRLEALPPASRVEIDGRNCRRIDHDVLELIREFEETAKLRKIDLRLIDVPAQTIMPSH